MTIKIPISKKCYKCNAVKPAVEFYKDGNKTDGLSYRCKECTNAYNKFLYQKNDKKILERNKNYRQRNRERVLEAKREEYKRNSERYAEYRKKYLKLKLEEDIDFKFKHQLRARIRIAIKKGYKSGSAVRDLGCSTEYARNFIESKFVEGMSWNNYGEWHIDHIIPLSAYDLNKREQFLEAVNYKNLQPLWAKDNQSKGAKICQQ